MDAEGKPSGSKGPIIKVLAAIIAVGAVAVAATTGDSWAVRSILVLVAGDVAVRLWRW
jgi:Na+/H+ antiporter NhaC